MDHTSYTTHSLDLDQYAGKPIIYIFFSCTPLYNSSVCTVYTYNIYINYDDLAFLYVACLQTVPLFCESEERLLAKLAEQADKGEVTDIVE